MMLSRRWAALVVALVVLLAVTPVLAQDAAGDDKAAQLKKAADAIKTAVDAKKMATRDGRRLFKEGRALLIAEHKASLPFVTALLDEMLPQTRVNAAIILARIVKKNFKESAPPADLVKALTRCLNEQDDAVRYWGLVGLLDAKIADAVKAKALAQCLKLSRPRVLRIIAVSAAEARGLKAGAPVIVAHLKALMPKYKAEVKATLVRPVGWTDPKDGRGEEGELGGGPAAPRRPRTPVARGPEPVPGGEVRGVKTIPVDPDKFDMATAREFIPKVQALPIYEEVHLIGLMLEGVLKQGYKAANFGFKTTAPWALDKCVKKADEVINKK